MEKFIRVKASDLESKKLEHWITKDGDLYAGPFETYTQAMRFQFTYIPTEHGKRN